MVLLSAVSDKITGGLRGFFFWLGKLVASHPWIAIISTLVITAVSSFGLIKYNEILPPNESPWVPSDHPFLRRFAWVSDNILSKSGTRLQAIMFIPPPQTFLTDTYNYMLFETDRRTKALDSEKELTYMSICHIFTTSLEKEDCVYLYFAPNGYITTGIRNLLINHKGKEIRASRFTILTKGPSNVNWKNKFSDAFLSTSEYGSGSSELEKQFAWEERLEKLRLKNQTCAGLAEECALMDNTKMLIFTSSGLFRDNGASLKSDSNLIVAGYFLIFVYASLAFGRFNCVENKIMLGVATMLTVIISLVVAVSLGSLMGVHMGVLNTLLVYLILGIGIDDSFVIISALDNVNRDQPGLDLKTKMATALSHAGVSITVTSMTDLVAFVISAFSAMPVIQSFCTYAALATAILFIMQAVFFTACLTIDESRRLQNRNAVFCCHKTDRYKAASCSKTDIQTAIFEKYIGPGLMKSFTKASVVCLMISLLAVSIYGMTKLEFDGDREQSLPESSATKQYLIELRKLGPLRIPAALYFKKGFDYYRRNESIANLLGSIKKADGVLPDSFQDWYTQLHELAIRKRDIKAMERTEAFSVREQHECEYYGNISKYLNTHVFFKYRLGISVFLDNQEYNKRRDSLEYLRRRHVTKSFIHFSVALTSSDKRNRDIAFNLQKTTEKECPNDECFVFSTFFVWAASVDVVQKELFRNVGLALACVLVMMLLLLANMVACLIVTVTVVLTVVNTMGMMHFLGIQLDIVVNVLIIMSVGFAVDFSAHVGHAFLCSRGSRNERARAALRNLGPAVFNGGFSTFLVFLPVAFTTAPIFFMFFQIIALCMGFGLWNGLVVLPVFLSLIGPAPYSFTEKEPNIPVPISSTDDYENNKQLGRITERSYESRQTRSLPLEHVMMANGYPDEKASRHNDPQNNDTHTLPGLFMNTNTYDPDYIHGHRAIASNQRLSTADDPDGHVSMISSAVHELHRPNVHPQASHFSPTYTAGSRHDISNETTTFSPNYIR